MKRSGAMVLVVIVSMLVPALSFGQSADPLAVYNEPPSRLRGLIEKFDQDIGILNRYYTAQTSPNRIARFKSLYEEKMQLIMDLYTKLYEATGGKIQQTKIMFYYWK